MGMASSNEPNHNNQPDNAGVAFHPPIMLAAFLVAGFGLRAALTLPFAPEVFVSLVGPIVVALAFVLFIWAAVIMHRGRCFNSYQ